jgi:hypothetical protein
MTNNPISLFIGDKLKDWKNEYEVVDMKYENSHSQYPSHYFIKCYKGEHEGRDMWVGNYDLQDYLPGGKFCGKKKGIKK